jgi:hypothetical protein
MRWVSGTLSNCGIGWRRHNSRSIWLNGEEVSCAIDVGEIGRRQWDEVFDRRLVD